MEETIEIEKLKDYAAKLMFDMDDQGYERTLEEFETVEKHMALIDEIYNSLED